MKKPGQKRNRTTQQIDGDRTGTRRQHRNKATEPSHRPDPRTRLKKSISTGPSRMTEHKGANGQNKHGTADRHQQKATKKTEDSQEATEKRAMRTSESHGARLWLIIIGHHVWLHRAPSMANHRAPNMANHRAPKQTCARLIRLSIGIPSNSSKSSPKFQRKMVDRCRRVEGERIERGCRACVGSSFGGVEKMPRKNVHVGERGG
jgi:hypothetical protein